MTRRDREALAVQRICEEKGAAEQRAEMALQSIRLARKALRDREYELAAVLLRLGDPSEPRAST